MPWCHHASINYKVSHSSETRHPALSLPSCLLRLCPNSKMVPGIVEPSPSHRPLSKVPCLGPNRAGSFVLRLPQAGLKAGGMTQERVQLQLPTQYPPKHSVPSKAVPVNSRLLVQAFTPSSDFHSCAPSKIRLLPSALFLFSPLHHLICFSSSRTSIVLARLFWLPHGSSL